MNSFDTALKQIFSTLRNIRIGLVFSFGGFLIFGRAGVFTGEPVFCFAAIIFLLLTVFNAK